VNCSEAVENLIREIRGSFIGHELHSAAEPQPNQKADYVHVHVNDHVHVFR